jgi:nucleoside-diphosphate-sugar epimerase
MQIFMTGATGFVGGALVRQLVDQGDQVTALVRDPGQAADLAKLGIRLATGDITDKDSMRPAMAGADGVYHVAGWYKVGVGAPDEAYAINVQGTRNVLELMAELGVAKGVYTSTLAANGDTNGLVLDEEHLFEGYPVTLYDRTKRQAHAEVAAPMMKNGLPLVVVLPGIVYGPGDTGPTGDALRDYLAGDLPTLPTRAAACWAHVDDVARGHILAMKRGRPGQDYIIAGECHTYIEVFEIAEAVCGVPAPRLRIPWWVLRSMAWPATLLGRFVHLPANYTAEVLRTTAGTTYLGTNAKARLELGYQPRDLRSGLRHALPAYGV